MSKNQKNLKHLYSLEPMSDDTFAFIAGRTPAGIPYGTTWEEIGIDPALPFEEKQALYASGEYDSPSLGDGISDLAPAQYADLQNILSTLKHVHTELAAIGAETGIDDILDAADWVENAMVGIEVCVSSSMPVGRGDGGGGDADFTDSLQRTNCRSETDRPVLC